MDGTTIKEMEQSKDIPGLIEVFRLGEVSKCMDAFNALVKIGAPVVDSLIISLKDKDAKVRKWAAKSLGEIKDPSAVDALIEAMTDEQSPVADAAFALQLIGDPRAVPPLIQSINHKDLFVARMAAQVLGSFPGPLVIEPLIAALGHTDYHVRKNAIGAIAHTGDPRAVGLLINKLADESWLMRASAAWALGFISSKIKSTRLVGQMETALKRVLKDPYVDDGIYPVREEAKKALKVLHGED